MKYMIYILFINCVAAYNFPTKIQHCGIEYCDVDNLEACTDNCRSCYSTGLKTCGYCKGTGFLTINDELIGTNNPCVACDGKGENECTECRGAGRIAKWRKQILKN